MTTDTTIVDVNEDWAVACDVQHSAVRSVPHVVMAMISCLIRTIVWPRPSGMLPARASPARS